MRRILSKICARYSDVAFRDIVPDLCIRNAIDEYVCGRSILRGYGVAEIWQIVFDSIHLLAIQLVEDWGKQLGPTEELYADGVAN